jgi:hypothetical protein
MVVILRRLVDPPRPIELLRRAHAVAVRAPNVTPRDLTLKSCPRDMIDQPRYRSPLLRWIAMIEFKYDRVALATIGTGMLHQVVVDLLTALLAIEPSLRGGAFQVRGPVPSIVFS